jgi:hypothetical protein
MTTPANALTGTIEHECSPMLLAGEEQFSTWLTGSRQKAFGLDHASGLKKTRIVPSVFEKEVLLNTAHRDDS